MQDPESNPDIVKAEGRGGVPPDLPSGPSGLGHDPPTVRSGGSSTSGVIKPARDAPRALALPVAGERIEPFEVEQSIGVGGMGAVFRALDTRLDRHVALKILPPEQANDSDVVQRFYQEGRAAARLDHENIARVFTIGNDGRYHYIAFEYIAGTTVRQRVEQLRAAPVGEAVNFTLQIADALVHASERGVVHRDIKPSNIVVTPHGRAKLVDMGLARRFERGVDDGLTQSGMTLGTFDYISPEQARDPRDVDVRSDLYSLGCTLFHMLTGKPPFPDGTVLQKLIQHQEDTPPDVRSLNPSVPPDLASVLVKLMAKERDRRYQTPEQLVRDLLTVAGALGLRSVSPEGLVWMSAKPPAVWERHLVWGIPAVAFGLILIGLFWWSQDATTLPPMGEFQPTSVVQIPIVKGGEGTRGDRPVVSNNSAVPGGPAQVGTSEQPPQVATPRDSTVGSDEDLLAVIAAAPSRSEIVLTDDGPYLLGDTMGGRGTGVRLDRKDVVIRADQGVRPVLRFGTSGPTSMTPRRALLDFIGGRVTLEGLEFLLEPGERTEPLAAVVAEDTDLTIRRCVFRRLGTSAGPKRLAACRVSATSRGGERAPATVFDKSHFDGAQIGVLGVGAVEIVMRDCTVAVTEPSIALESAKATTDALPDLSLRHVTFLAGESPLFRFDSVAPRVWVEDSVFAAAGEGEGTLVASDRPERFSWRGRSNLFSRIRVFLLPTDNVLGREAIDSPSRWKETAEEVRETNSTFTIDPTWEYPDPARLLAKEFQNPTRAFRLKINHAGGRDVGVRQGPNNSLMPPETIAAGGTSRTDPDPPGSMPIVSPSSIPSKKAAIPPTELIALTTSPMPKGMDDPADLQDLPVATPPSIPTSRPAGSDKSREPEDDSDIFGGGVPVAEESKRPVAPPIEVRSDPSLIRTATQFRNALSDAGANGGVIRIAADADWVLPSVPIRAAGSWRIQAEKGATRPRLRFLPSPPDPMALPDWTGLIDLQTGSLQLEGIDVVLPKMNAPLRGGWAAFVVRAATDLSLTDCTVTVEGSQENSAIVAVSTSRVGEVRPAVEPVNVSPATVRVNDCLLRAGDDCVDIRGGQSLKIEINNAIVSTGGSLLHAHGLPAGQTADTVSLTLRQVTARVAGGLIRLQSAPGEPELPVADVNARDTILATTDDPMGSPLIRVDGQVSPAAMRDRIVWEGHRVAYHQIRVYRQDQTTQLGTVPTHYDRRDWNVAVGARESTPLHGDVKFVELWQGDRQAWQYRREDARLAKDSPARLLGPDLSRLPNAPFDTISSAP